MGTQEVQPAVVARPVLNPKAIIYQKFGSKACYEINEEVGEPLEISLPGSHTRTMYRCTLNLPEQRSFTSEAFTKKKNAEISAARITIEKLGIQSTDNVRSPQEAQDLLVDRISGFFTNEFLPSKHPLLGHFRVAMRRVGDLCGMIPLYAFAACDVKVNNFCKIINPKAESNPLLVLSTLLKAARMSCSICIADGEFWIKKKSPFSTENLQSLTSCSSGTSEYKHIEAIRVPCSIEEHVKALTLDVSDNMYYMDEMAKKLNAGNSSRVLVSRRLGKASSELRLFFAVPEVLRSIDSYVNLLENKRASYISGQKIYGDAILANVGYTWKDKELSVEDVSLCDYYRILLKKVPDGLYKLSRNAILSAELPTAYIRSDWKGPSPKTLLSFFCVQHQLSEPIFSVECLSSNITKEVQLRNESDGNGHVTRSSNFSCEVKLLTRRQEPFVEFSFNTINSKECAIQNAALQVLGGLNKYFKQLDMPMEDSSSFEYFPSIKVCGQNFFQQLALWSSIHRVDQIHYQGRCNSLGSAYIDHPNKRQKKETALLNIKGPDCGIFLSPGSLVCINYTVTLVRKEEESLKENLEKNNEFEFEIGTDAVIKQLETCVSKLSSNQSAQFSTELPSRELILAASSESTSHLQGLSLHNCVLEYSVRLLKVTEPLDKRMEQALFVTRLSKQRVKYAVGRINESDATTLMDFGCGSGMIFGISCKSLARAAKILDSKSSTNSEKQSNSKSAVLYKDSIAKFASHLYGLDIGTCLEEIEELEEDQVGKLGDAVLCRFCPRKLIVSTPNYEDNPLLEKKAASLGKKDSPLPGTEDELEEKSDHDCKLELPREKFEHWATVLAKKHKYSVEFSGVGDPGTEEPGNASQIAIFKSKLKQAEKKTFYCYKVKWVLPKSKVVLRYFE